MSLDVYLEVDGDDDEVYSANITHNLNQMADKAGLYECMWRPDEHGFEYAHQIIALLENGLKVLKRDPTYFRKFNSANGWGNYDNFVHFVEKYLAACREYPTAKIRVSR